MGVKKCCQSKCCLIASVVWGVLSIAIGISLLCTYDLIFNSIVKAQTRIVPGSIMYELSWEEVDLPIYRSFYVYNVTNKEEFLAQEPGNYVKPVLQQLGPYVYREYLKKDRIDYKDYNKTHREEVSFRQTATFFFEPELSNGTEEDTLTALNIIATMVPPSLENLLEEPLLSAAYGVYNKAVVDTNTKLLFTMTVGEYLWGFDDPLLNALTDLLPGVEFESFGMLLVTNVSRGWRSYQVYSGRGDYRLNNKITQFQNMSILPYWRNDTCNQLNGTDGTMTAPFMNKEDRVYFYVDEMCRSAYTTFEKDTDVLGIKGWKFIMPPEIYMSPINNKENWCFCLDDDHVSCQHDGGYLVSPCSLGAPMLLSFPHFLYSDDYYSSKLVGMNPIKEKHELYMIFEPTLGIVMDTRSRVQLNMFMEPNPRASILNQIQEKFAFPMVWLEEQATMTQTYASWANFFLYVMDDLFLGIEIVAIIVGVVLLGWGIGYPLYTKQHKKNKLSDDHSLDSPSQKKKKPPAARTVSTTELMAKF